LIIDDGLERQSDAAGVHWIRQGNSGLALSSRSTCACELLPDFWVLAQHFGNDTANRFKREIVSAFYKALEPQSVVGIDRVI
jgi:hypothetical protein